MLARGDVKCTGHKCIFGLSSTGRFRRRQPKGVSRSQNSCDKSCPSTWNDAAKDEFPEKRSCHRGDRGRRQDRRCRAAGCPVGPLCRPVFWQMLRETGTPVIPVDEADLEAAWQIMHAFPDRSFSFTDCTAFAVMERLRIERIFAFDRHFLVYRYGPGRRKAFTCEP